jgi:4-azaleucine resistance transporter AzlC
MTVLTDSPISPRQEFLNGIKLTLPLLVGVVPFGMIFGALALTSGLSAGATLGMSAFVFAGSAQFIAATLVGSGAGVWIIILTTFVVNLRHLLYSVTLTPYLKHLPTGWQAMLAFWLTDESFVVVSQRYAEPDTLQYKHWFFLGSALSMYLSWFASTVIGILAGQTIPDPLSWGLDFALPVTFIGILIPLLKDRAMIIAAFAAGVVAVLAHHLDNQLGLLVAALAGILAGIIADQFSKLPKQEVSPIGQAQQEQP